MGQKENATLVEATGGQLKYIQTFKPKISDVGFDIDFTILNFEQNSKKCNHIEIFNTGSDKCMIGFDTQAKLVDCEDLTTFSFIIYPGSPFSYISLDGEADSISMRTESGKITTLELVVW